MFMNLLLTKFNSNSIHFSSVKWTWKDLETQTSEIHISAHIIYFDALKKEKQGFKPCLLYF